MGSSQSIDGSDRRHGRDQSVLRSIQNQHLDMDQYRLLLGSQPLQGPLKQHSSSDKSRGPYGAPNTRLLSSVQQSNTGGMSCIPGASLQAPGQQVMLRETVGPVANNTLNSNIPADCAVVDSGIMVDNNVRSQSVFPTAILGTTSSCAPASRVDLGVDNQSTAQATSAVPLSCPAEVPKANYPVLQQGGTAKPQAYRPSAECSVTEENPKSQLAAAAAPVRQPTTVAVTAATVAKEKAARPVRLGGIKRPTSRSSCSHAAQLPLLADDAVKLPRSGAMPSLDIFQSNLDPGTVFQPTSGSGPMPSADVAAGLASRKRKAPSSVCPPPDSTSMASAAPSRKAAAAPPLTATKTAAGSQQNARARSERRVSFRDPLTYTLGESVHQYNGQKTTAGRLRQSKPRARRDRRVSFRDPLTTIFYLDPDQTREEPTTAAAAVLTTPNDTAAAASVSIDPSQGPAFKRRCLQVEVDLSSNSTSDADMVSPMSIDPEEVFGAADETAPAAGICQQPMQGSQAGSTSNASTNSSDIHVDPNVWHLDESCGGLGSGQQAEGSMLQNTAAAAVHCNEAEVVSTRGVKRRYLADTTNHQVDEVSRKRARVASAASSQLAATVAASTPSQLDPQQLSMPQARTSSHSSGHAAPAVSQGPAAGAAATAAGAAAAAGEAAAAAVAAAPAAAAGVAAAEPLQCTACGLVVAPVKSCKPCEYCGGHWGWREQPGLTTRIWAARTIRRRNNTHPKIKYARCETEYTHRKSRLSVTSS